MTVLKQHVGQGRFRWEESWKLKRNWQIEQKQTVKERISIRQGRTKKRSQEQSKMVRRTCSVLNFSLPLLWLSVKVLSCLISRCLSSPSLAGRLIGKWDSSSCFAGRRVWLQSLKSHVLNLWRTPVWFCRNFFFHGVAGGYACRVRSRHKQTALAQPCTQTAPQFPPGMSKLKMLSSLLPGAIWTWAAHAQTAPPRRDPSMHSSAPQLRMPRSPQGGAL